MGMKREGEMEVGAGIIRNQREVSMVLEVLLTQ